jgi:hypothetical protein
MYEGKEQYNVPGLDSCDRVMRVCIARCSAMRVTRTRYVHQREQKGLRA